MSDQAKRTMLAAGLVVGSVFFAGAIDVGATPQELQSLKKTYPAKASEFSCKTCHEAAAGSAKNLNYYGRAMQKFMAAVQIKAMTPEHFKRMEEYDDDGDGIYNGDELKAGTNPGDPVSKPGAEPPQPPASAPAPASEAQPVPAAEQQPASAAIPEPAAVSPTESAAPVVEQPPATQPAPAPAKDKKKSRRAL